MPAGFGSCQPSPRVLDSTTPVGSVRLSAGSNNGDGGGGGGPARGSNAAPIGRDVYARLLSPSTRPRKPADQVHRDMLGPPPSPYKRLGQTVSYDNGNTPRRNPPRPGYRRAPASRRKPARSTSGRGGEGRGFGRTLSSQAGGSGGGLPAATWSPEQEEDQQAVNVAISRLSSLAATIEEMKQAVEHHQQQSVTAAGACGGDGGEAAEEQDATPPPPPASPEAVEEFDSDESF
eukprot:SAG22_NODE_70_length_22717_cov_12.413741_16_plen_233_part_00